VDDGAPALNGAPARMVRETMQSGHVLCGRTPKLHRKASKQNTTGIDSCEPERHVTVESCVLQRCCLLS
jgi:hypothetical protein